MRLIDADAMRRELIKWRDNDHYRKKRSLVERWVRTNGINVLLRVLANFPTVDAEPVKHGWWIRQDWVCLCYKCSACGEEIWRTPSDYCPNCGAKMDGGTDHADTQ